MRNQGLIVLLIALSLMGCGCWEDHKLETIATNNPSIPVDLLLEKDGCKVYRFLDASSYKYFVTCTGSVNWNEKRIAGKVTKTYRHMIPTHRSEAND